uniref:RING-type domain-containing protein n=2 Tax=Leptocylindrus danicus TaxID=163516 RepID=A0A7S2LQY3_9STRA|mmetsp:Transcript_8884/g.13167  ORF Transcript_8884/g.13167 Transcript_8884/m.13167 type:complete len:291 (+) Transcript_8884:247-1119(+)|eukprot:CAMPEP_0116027730 /NCGR_PEP_ID=MMETSP0321-20121206/14865_1 /TAXON_ID=163516 /ORGANISM="Leptocylindrus danicus var. danicus, Strain B650" /LENGTH=290 /DNA_ID=CAMNT_0003501265 /DNA_START=193 /DNA_END=1065 /DNA_ORIENTATION=+
MAVDAASDVVHDAMRFLQLEDLRDLGDNYEDDYYEEETDLRWFLLQTLILVAAMVTCVRCVSICIAYRDQQVYEQLIARHNLMNANDNDASRRRRWIGDDPPLSLEEVMTIPEIRFVRSAKMLTDCGEDADDNATMITEEEDTKCTTLDGASQSENICIPVTTDSDSQVYCTMCSVCLDEFEENEVVRQLPCRHLFHGECITPWLTQRSGNCPLCKVAVQAGNSASSSEDSGAESGSDDNDEQTTSRSHGRRFFSWRGWRSTSLPANDVARGSDLREPLIEVSEEDNDVV